MTPAILETQQASVHIVEDDKEVCEALNWLLTSVNIKTQTYHHALDFLERFDSNIKEGCIILDIRMPNMSGLQLQEILNKRRINLPLIFITGHGDISMAVKAMREGAFDFITKPFNNQALLEQIQKALSQSKLSYKNRTLYSDNLVKKLQQLSPREHEVLKHVIAGKTNKQISTELHIAISTVELHRSKVMNKLEVKNIIELVKNYIKIQEFQTDNIE